MGQDPSLAPVQCDNTSVAQVAFIREGSVILLSVPELGLAGFTLECSSPMAVDVFTHVTALWHLPGTCTMQGTSKFLHLQRRTEYLAKDLRSNPTSFQARILSTPSCSVCWSPFIFIFVYMVVWPQEIAQSPCSLNSPSIVEFGMLGSVHQVPYRSGLLGKFGESYKWKKKSDTLEG